jgi:Neutral/alkaline non-lysosomal ceramidase, N-terminal
VLARSASCDITPRGRPIRLAGYAPRTKPVATILDAIEISAVLLEGAGARCVIFSFDLMIVGSELQDMILTRLAGHGFQPSEIVLLASHTHFAPATDRACARLGVVEKQFVSDVAEAAEGLVLRMLQQQPSEIMLQISQGRLNHSVNRRRYWPFPTLGRTYGFRLRSIAMAPSPLGETEELATVVSLRRADSNEVIGAIWHYTCHPTAVIPNNAISSDFPGAVRRALRARFGDIACVFVQGFCGDVSPMLRPAARKVGSRERLRRFARKVISGPTFPAAVAEDWTRWSENLAAKVVEVALGSPQTTAAPATLATGSASIPLADFFDGSVPDKPLTAQAVRLGDALELIALSAEVTVEWQAIVDRALPVQNGRIRLHAGYLGALFGYLPTPGQIREGGYEVEGFQPLFGLSGTFDAEKITPAVIHCVKQAVAGLEPAG